MISIEAVLLGLVIFGALAVIPFVVAAVGFLVWGTRPRGNAGRRQA